MAKLGWCSAGQHGFTDHSEPNTCPGKVKGRQATHECDCECHSNPHFPHRRQPVEGGDAA